MAFFAFWLAFLPKQRDSQYMVSDLVQIRALAKKKEDENWSFRRFLKIQCDLDPSEMDRQVSEVTKRVWAGIDCTTCANCCREVKPTFSEEEVLRLSRRLGISSEQFVVEYLEPTEGRENPWQTRRTPCPFLEDNRCSVYSDRPANCQGYPYLYEPDFAFRTISMIERTFTCPIVYEVIEELKQSWGFLRRKRRR
jgi:Fe-S-cluster containining protein